MPPKKMHRPDCSSHTEVECRVCTKLTLDAVSLFSSMNTKDEENSGKTIVDVIREFADVKLTLDDERSKHICLACLKELANGIHLRQQIRANEQEIVFTVLHNTEEPNAQLDEHEYELEYLDEFKDEITNGTGLPTQSTKLEVIDESMIANDELLAQENDELSNQITIELSEEEIECLEDRVPEQGKFAFEMPPAELIAQRIAFDEFEYLEIQGERCCGCAHIASSRDTLMMHAKEVHSQNYYADSSYTCPTCYQKFPTEESLIKHTQYYSYNDVFLCTECQEAFNFKSHLMLHLKQEHHHQPQDELDEESEPQTAKQTDSRKSYEHSLVLPDKQIIKDTREFPLYRQYLLDGECCCACGVYLESVEPHATQEHLNLEDILAWENALKCTICRRKFASHRQLVLHEQERKKLGHLYECRQCGKLFAKKHILLKHLQKEKNHANEVTYAEGDDSALNQGGAVISSPADVECFCCCFRRCKEEYTTEAELVKHAGEAHAGRRKENEIKLTAAQVNEVNEENVCPICLRLFESVEKLRQHRSYKMHVENQSCHQCGRVFMRLSGLREHQEREHLDLPPRYTCKVCGKHFITNSTLKQHQRVHGPFKSCPCIAEGCDLVFRDERLMRRHYRNVHAENKPYACRHCQKVFRTKESLDIHERCHTGERPFPCRHEGCVKRFSHGTDRLRHERSVHTGERPHKCSVCSSSFLRKRELRLHTEKLHQEL